ncbi:MAG: hypothetical protein K2J20_03480 [Bacilli bacterium]|nr:hypothetical protein [Bacilli bacterium]
MNKYNIKEITEKLEKFKKIPLSEINLNDVDDLKDIKISRKKCKEERILDFIITAKNPYVFKVDGVIVKISFSNNGKKTEDCLTRVLENLYR